jgi:hypothetical protein
MAVTDKLVKWAAAKAFAAVDVDKTGHLDEKELYVCILLVYDGLNRRLPTPLAPPTMVEVRDLMKKFDKNADGSLTLEEFEPVMKTIIFRKKAWRDSVVVRFGWALLLKIVLVPLVAGYVTQFFVSKNSKYSDSAPGVITSVIDLVSKYTLLF